MGGTYSLKPDVLLDRVLYTKTVTCDNTWRANFYMNLNLPVI